MNFRERPEYQEWRNQVIEIFGNRCILCGHEGNIHVHHIRPVRTFPESALDPKNGVPLCGNCHSEVNAHELSYIEEFERRQELVLAGDFETLWSATDAPSEESLKRQAEADPSNTQAVEKWFGEASDPTEVVAFYNKHHKSFKKTAPLYAFLACNLAKMQRWSDVVKVADGAMQCLEKNGKCQGVDEIMIDMIIFHRVEALNKLGREDEGIAFIRKMITRFSDNARVYHQLSYRLGSFLNYSSPDKELLTECLSYACQAATLKPDDYSYLSWATFLSRIAKKYADSLRYAEQALVFAGNDTEKVEALNDIAAIYEQNNLYRDAIAYLRQALQIDEHNVRVLSDMAHCYYMEDNVAEALRMARRGLMLDPNDTGCQQTLRCCEKR